MYEYIKKFFSISLLAIFLFACESDNYTSKIDNKGYNSNDLAKKWRQGLKNNYPRDNDADYHYPLFNGQVPMIAPPIIQYPYGFVPQDNDSVMPKYPRYDSEADNGFPMYFDQ